MSIRHTMTRRSWTDSEDWVLEVLTEERFSGKAIGKILVRSVSMIYSRRRVLKIRNSIEFRNDVSAAKSVIRRDKHARKNGKLKVAFG